MATDYEEKYNVAFCCVNVNLTITKSSVKRILVMLSTKHAKKMVDVLVN